MIHFFKQKTLLLVAIFSVVFKNNGMNSIVQTVNSKIPYNFCGKEIKRTSSFEKISMTKYNGTSFPCDIFIKFGENLLGTEDCNYILASWQHKYSVNQYINFICLASKFADKIKCNVATLLIGIDAISKDNFFRCIEDITVEEIAQKVNHNTVITVIEYALLNSIPVKRDALPINRKKVWVKRTFIEKCHMVNSKQLTADLKIALSINMVMLAGAYGINVIPIEGLLLSNVIAIPFQIMWTCFCHNQNILILKSYEPNIID